MTGAGKDHPLKVGKNLLRALGFADSIGPDEFVSSGGLLRRLKRNSLLACFIDELGDELAKIKSQAGNTAVGNLFGLFKKLYNAFEIPNTAEYAQGGEGKDSEALTWPAFSILGAGTPAAVFGVIDARDVESGVANRFVVLPYEGVEQQREQLLPDGADIPPAELIAALKRLPRQRATTAAEFLNGVAQKREDGKIVVTGLEPKLAPRMGWGPGAAEAYLAFSHRNEDFEKTDRRLYYLARRGAENAIRLATIVAVGRGSSVVDLEDIRWGIALADRSITTSLGGIEKYMQEYLAFPQLCERVFNKIVDGEDGVRGWRRLRLLNRDFRNSQKLGFELDVVFKQLRKEGRIVLETRYINGQASEGYAAVDEFDAAND
jgi:hypothetical protein